MNKLLSIVGILALSWILASWKLTGQRPADWFIAITLGLQLVNRIVEVLTGE